MGRGRADPTGHRGGKGCGVYGIRDKNDEPRDPTVNEIDPRCYVWDPAEEQLDPAHEDYLWPEYEDENDD